MYGDARLGTLDWVEWVTLTNGGLDYTFPLVRQSIQRQPMFSFPQTTQQGPIDRPSLDPRLSYVSLLNDLTGGLGYQTIEPTDSLARYYWGSLDTRFKGYVTLPQKVKTTLALPSYGTFGTPRLRTVVVTSTTRYCYIWSIDNNAASTYIVNEGTQAYVGVTTPAVMDVTAFNSNLVALDTTNRRPCYSAAGTTFTNTVASGTWYGLAEFDNKVWSFNLTDRTLYACVDPTQGLYVAPSTNPNGWRAESDALQLGPGETPTQLIAWRNNQGQAALYLVTNLRLIGYDDESGEWAPYDTFGVNPDDNGRPRFVMWPRDRQLYGVIGNVASSSGRQVRQYTGTVSDVGPTHQGQLGKDHWDFTYDIAASLHHVFVWYQGSASQGVLAYNEQGGWHPAFTVTNGKNIDGGGYHGGNLYFLYTDGTLDIVDYPDDSTPPFLLSPTTQATSGNITLAEIDCGAPGVWKLGAYLYVDARKSDNSCGLPTNSALTINAPLADGVALGNFLILHDSDTFPAIIGLDTVTMSLTAQGGMPFRRLQLSLVLGKAATTDQSARLVDVALYYDLWREQRYAYQFAIDFTDTAWGYPRALAGGLDRGAAIAELLSLQLTKRRFKVTFGGSGDRQVVIPAAEIIVASRADDNQRGIFPCTIRDVSAPASG